MYYHHLDFRHIIWQRYERWLESLIIDKPQSDVGKPIDKEDDITKYKVMNWCEMINGEIEKRMILYSIKAKAFIQRQLIQ